MSLVLVTALALAPAPTRADTPRAAVVVAPLAVEGRLDAAWQIEFEQRVRAGLRRGAVELVERDGAGSCGDDDACWAAFARASSAAFVVEARVSIFDRDYDVHVLLRAADDGGVRAHVEGRCELCGLDEAAQRVSDAAAAIADELELRRVTVAAAIATPVPADPVPGRTHARDRVRITGFALLGVGLAAVIAGAPLIAIDERPVTSRCSGQDVNPFGVCKYRHATLEGGAVLVATGAAAVIAGTVMAIVGRRHPRRMGWRGHGFVVRF